MKQCTKCKEWKDKNQFNKCSKNPDGLQYRCKDCQKKIYYENHEYYKQYDVKRTQSKERIKYKQQYDKQYYENNRDKRIIYAKEFYKTHKENWQLTEEQKQKKKEYYTRNRDKINKQKRLLRANSPIKRINESISSNIYYSIKGNKQNEHWEDLVDFTFEELKQHLENQFTSEMSWDNYGTYWEIDHIIPVNTFNFTSIEDKDFRICWSLMNLRPLEKIANRKRPKDGSDINDTIKNKILKGVDKDG